MKLKKIMSFILMFGLLSCPLLANNEENNTAPEEMVQCLGITPENANAHKNEDGSFTVSEKECMDKGGSIVEQD